MAHVDWYVEGPSYGNCNCGYSCPCQFEELPTHGDCRGFEVLEVTKGHFGDTDLAGTKAALMYAWPGPIFEGKGEMQVIIDPSATQAQRDALEKIFQGKETEDEATHWWVFHAMCDTVHDTVLAPIDYSVDIDERTEGPVDNPTGGKAWQGAGDGTAAQRHRPSADACTGREVKVAHRKRSVVDRLFQLQADVVI